MCLKLKYERYSGTMREFDTIPAQISCLQAYLVVHIAVNKQYHEKIYLIIA
jgi:hypothetical protein